MAEESKRAPNENRRKPPVRRHGPGPRLTEKPKDFKGTIIKLLKYLSLYRIRLIIIFVFAIGSTIFAIVGPKILGNATTELFNGLVSLMQGGAGIDLGAIGSILLGLLIMYVASSVLSYVTGWVMADVSMALTYRLRKEISEKIHRMPFRLFDDTNHGETLSIITNDVDTLSQTMNQGLTQMVTSVVTIIGVGIMMFSIDWLMTLIAIAILPLSMVFMGMTIKLSQKHFKRQQDYLGHVNGQIEEVFGAQSVVRVFNAEERSLKKFEKDNDELYKSAWKSQFISGLMHPIMMFVGNISYVAVAIIGGYFAFTGRITVGNIQSFIQYTRQFTQPIGQLAQVSSILQSTAAAAERVFAFLEQIEEDQTVPNAVDVAKLPANDLSVDFTHVKFGYNEDKIIIRDFCAHVTPGQKIAIVGHTGAGKTTMIKLLMRFYDVTGGSIEVGGQDVRRFNRSELRGLFGMVLQDAWLFGGSIKENIRYGRENATDDEVTQAAKSAHVHHFIQTLPEGYDTVISEDASNVSTGQKQLLTIARAILADPKILILDEATSSVDTRTEERIQKAMDNLMRGRTSFIIAHRLSTIKNADLILLMKDGDIAEQGTHDELLAQNGFYAELYNSQFEHVS
jgi:ATP-binding cassette subfamily B protein